MKKLQNSRRELMNQLNTVNYVIKNCENAYQDGNSFIDDTIKLHNADGFDWYVLDRSERIKHQEIGGTSIIAKVKIFKQLKRRPKESVPIKVYGKQEFSLTERHLQTLLNHIDHKAAFSVLKKALTCQEVKS